MWDPRSRSVHTTRDVTGLKKMHFPKVGPSNDVKYIQTHQEKSIDDDNENDSNKEDFNSVSNDNDDLIEVQNKEEGNDSKNHQIQSSSLHARNISKKFRNESCQ